MKGFRIPAIFCALLLATNVANAAPCTSGNCVSNQSNATGVRQYGGLGTKNWSKRVFQKTTKGWFRTEWNKVMATAVREHSCAFDQHYPTLVAKVHWSEAYVDSGIKPTRAQARDPNWSNYIWNRPESGSGFVYDGITDALNDPLVDNGNGIAKLAIIIGLTATSDNLIPPIWMRKDSSLAWVEGVNNNGKTDNWHVRFDNPVAVEHTADFLFAFLQKYGRNKGVHSVNLAEYFLGPASSRPRNFNRDNYIVGVKSLWEKVVQGAPRDADGNRVTLLQSNPLFNSQVSVQDLERIGMGVSESDTQLHFSSHTSPESAAMKQLYEGNKVHVMINGDARFACQGRRQYWDGTPNPFGHKKGYSAVATPQELFWFHSEDGPIPTHSIFLTMAPWCKGAPQNAANFIDAIKRFGRCGTEVANWGAAPAALPEGGAGSIVVGKPAPPAVVIR